MKKTLLIITGLIASFTSTADQWVNGYTRQNGTHVEGYHRSSPDGSTYNNYSSPGNSNPYTGSVGGYQPQQQYNGGSQSFGGNPQPLGGYNQPLGGSYR